MRITRKKFDKARKLVREAKEAMKIVRAWEAAQKAFPNQSIETVTVGENGQIKAECVIDSKAGSGATPNVAVGNVRSD